MRKGKRLSTIAVFYLMFGLIFAIAFALYYRWLPSAYFSPGFYAVIFTWPAQAFGLIHDFIIYGIAGKPI